MKKDQIKCPVCRKTVLITVDDVTLSLGKTKMEIKNMNIECKHCGYWSEWRKGGTPTDEGVV